MDAPAWQFWLRRLESLLVFVLAALFYVSLYGELPYHDAQRFAAQLSSDRFVYDLGHVLLEPAALLWHRWLGFGEPVVASQKHISTVATAAAIAIFYGLLIRLGWRAGSRCSPRH